MAWIILEKCFKNGTFEANPDVIWEQMSNYKVNQWKGQGELDQSVLVCDWSANYLRRQHLFNAWMVFWIQTLARVIIHVAYYI